MRNLLILSHALILLVSTFGCQGRPPSAGLDPQDIARAVADKPSAQVARAKDAIAEVKRSLKAASPALERAHAKAQEASRATTIPDAHAAAIDAAQFAQEAQRAIDSAESAVPVIEQAGSYVVAHVAKTESDNAALRDVDAQPWRRASYLLGAAAVICGIGWAIIQFASTVSPIIRAVAIVAPPLLWEVVAASFAGAAVFCGVVARYQVAIERLAFVAGLVLVIYVGLRFIGRRWGLRIPYPRICKLHFTGWSWVSIYDPKRYN